MDRLIEEAIALLQKGQMLPEEYQSVLFPVNHAEYELTYKAKQPKERILAIGEEPQSTPFQVSKVFGEVKDEGDWKNLLIFGDNFQVLKTLYENKDELIKNKIKGKVKLIYIDPPFATQDEFQNKDGAKAYSDKIKGAEFLEFLRQRLILARELLSEDGSIFVHLDSKMCHYVKIVLDEVFDKNNFQNEIVWQKLKAAKKQAKTFGNVHDTIFYYSKNATFLSHNKQYRGYSDELINSHYSKVDENGRRYTDDSFTQTGNGCARRFGERGLIAPPPGKHWIWGQKKIDEGMKNGRIIFTSNGTPRVKRYLDEREGIAVGDIWTDIHPINSQAIESIDYPTQKPEALLERIIKSASNENDLIMDFFAGSGTTLAVAEKLGRRWIGCDIGKLSIYTIQKRFLTMQEKAKPFAVVNAGCYDLDKVFKLTEEKYNDFVCELFHIEKSKKKTKINGIEVDGKRRGDWCIIYPYQKFKSNNTAVDEAFIENLDKKIKGKIGDRFYIVAPEMNVDIIGDYYIPQGSTTRYYILKIPYRFIQDLHKLNFKKLQQPTKKENINNIENSVGFYFNEQPDVKSHLEVKDKEVVLHIDECSSPFILTDIKDILAMVFIDTTNHEEFIMQETYFADEIKDGDKWRISIKKSNIKNDKIKVVYVDIFGNEFMEVLEVSQ
ncbi:modification methylase MboII [Oxobacter pfennigii]|uniref:Modification methylase MboII n=1 Tax=Oxobacter pfennigii TaxID=36849 RepID=A0A0P8YBM9_9CLOT|nr:site-specific DNA-methyltransferase [Oxobacter pfennigii]KPU44468.1 modification methylase MboII [Oxobacter pfennigii]